MSSMPYQKYRRFPAVDLPDRRWPSQSIDKAPIWCSVDLRDGNQALIEPMGHERKRRMFETLVQMGIKQIEVGFPSASQTDFDFARFLIEGGHIPDDVTIQVLTQAREELVRRTFEALQGCPRAIVHVYNSTSELQRRVVFRQDRAGIVDIAVKGVALVRELAKDYPDTDVTLEYSPESFTDTELDFAVEICQAVLETWGASPERKMILNLPGTVEVATPNVYADQIEWFSRHIKGRENFWLSLHPHNDRGTAVAACELAMMAGADRVEGTLFGNGERTGNLDIVTVALNLFTQGVDPELELGDIKDLVNVYEYCNRLSIHPRHPYAGELVFTAFSGSHQDAIKKGIAAQTASGSKQWQVPYLPIDPDDIGRAYEPVIRINSQSGKGGVAYVMEHDFGLVLPRKLQVEFSRIVQGITDAEEKELSPQEIWDAFEAEYLNPKGGYALADSHIDLKTKESVKNSDRRLVVASIADNSASGTGRVHKIEGEGNGPIDAFIGALRSQMGISIRLHEYSEHSVGKGADAKAVAYVEVSFDDGPATYGVGRHESILIASVHAVLSGLNRLRLAKQAAQAS